MPRLVRVRCPTLPLGREHRFRLLIGAIGRLIGLQTCRHHVDFWPIAALCCWPVRCRSNLHFVLASRLGLAAGASSANPINSGVNEAGTAHSSATTITTGTAGFHNCVARGRSGSKIRVTRAVNCRTRPTAACAKAICFRREASFRHMGQAFRIADRRAGMHQNGVIAGHFAVQRKPALDPPHAGKEEQQCFQNLLCQVRPIVAPAQVSQLMQQNVFQLFSRSAFQHPCREELPQHC